MKRVVIVAVAGFIVAAALAGCARDTGGLKVQVAGEGGMGVPGAKVISNEQPAGQLKVTGMTDSSGSVTYNDIKAGEYSFYISAAGYEQKDFEATVAGGKTTSVTIALTRTVPPGTNW